MRWCAMVLPILCTALRERGFDPRRVGTDSWESRCPVHRSTDHALSISRDGSDHVVLECRSSQHCLFEQIIRAVRLGYDTLYDETPDGVIRQLSDMPIQRAWSEELAGAREKRSRRERARGGGGVGPSRAARRATCGRRAHQGRWQHRTGAGVAGAPPPGGRGDNSAGRIRSGTASD